MTSEKQNLESSGTRTWMPRFQNHHIHFLLEWNASLSLVDPPARFHCRVVKLFYSHSKYIPCIPSRGLWRHWVTYTTPYQFHRSEPCGWTYCTWNLSQGRVSCTNSRRVPLKMTAGSITRRAQLMLQSDQGDRSQEAQRGPNLKRQACY